MGALHFLRPAWFFALLPLAALVLRLWRRRSNSGNWQAVVDPRLLRHLLIGSSLRRNPWLLAAVGLAGLLAITALAGPVWSKLKVPVFRRGSALVVLLDLSRSMNATDVQPSRLQMAKFKLRDILARRKEGDTALVVYAADPFPVTPLTSDTDNIVRQLPSLTTELMPAQGSRADRAIVKAQALLRQAGAVHGDVLLITDGIANTPSGPLQKAVKRLVAAGYRLSVLGVGTDEGAPIPVPNGGFFQDEHGAIVVARLDEGALRRLAATGHGIYRHLSRNDSDTDALIAAFKADLLAQHSSKVNGLQSAQWREQGPWLLLPLLPLAALAFRRGWLVAVLLALLLPMPRSAYAFEWAALWQNPDQRGAEALARHHPQQAARLFRDPRWRAAADYRRGDYRTALNDLKGQNGPVVDYNRGNILAHLGRLPQALVAYNKALKHDPDFADAKYNRDLVRKWLRSQPQHAAGASHGAHQKDGTKLHARPQPSSSAKQGRHDRRPAQQRSGAANGHTTPRKRTGSAQPQSARREHHPAKQETQAPNSHGRTANKEPKGSARPTGTREDARTAPHDESEQATRQWLRRIPDDPGGLWRRKFLLQYKREYRTQPSEAKPW